MSFQIGLFSKFCLMCLVNLLLVTWIEAIEGMVVDER